MFLRLNAEDAYDQADELRCTLPHGSSFGNESLDSRQTDQVTEGYNSSTDAARGMSITASTPGGAGPYPSAPVAPAKVHSLHASANRSLIPTLSSFHLPIDNEDPHI